MPSGNNFNIGESLSLKIAGLTLPVRIATRKNLPLLFQRFGKFLCVPSDNKLKNGKIRQKEHIVWRGNLYNFENSARRWFSVLLSEEGKDGILLHASGIVVKDRTRKSSVLFSGKSSSGKSTIAADFPDKEILSDELVAVVKNKNGYKAYPTPFRGFMLSNKKLFLRDGAGNRRNSTRTTDSKISAPAGGAKIKYIFFLVGKSPSLKITAPSYADTCRHILRNSFFVPPALMPEETIAKRAIRNAINFANWARRGRKAFFMEFSLEDIPVIKNIVGKNRKIQTL